MPKRRWWVRSLVFALVMVLGLGLGILSGKTYRRLRREAAAETYRETLQAGLERELRGIAIGQPFPDIPFRSVPGNSAVLVRDFLTVGGLLLYVVSDCESCFGSIQSLDRALAQLGQSPGEGLVVVQGDAGPVQRYIAHEDIQLRLVVDSEKALAGQYGVVIFPTVFRVNEDHIVENILADPQTVDDFVQVWSGRN